MRLPAFVCLSVCLIARLLKNACMYLDEMLPVDRCRDNWTNWLTFEPDPDCFLLYRMRCNAEIYYVGKIPRTGIGRPSLQRRLGLKWFYTLRAVGTPLLEVHALHRVPFYLLCPRPVGGH